MVRSQQDDDYFTFTASNRMTGEAEAFGVLHLLHHLRDTAFGYIWNKEGMLNGRIFDVLSEFYAAPYSYRLKCGYLYAYHMPTMAQMEEASKRIRFARVESRKAIAGTKLDSALQVCVSAGEMCGEVLFQVGVGPEICTEAVDKIVEVG